MRLVGLCVLGLERHVSVKPTFRAALDRGSSAAIEICRQGRSRDAWILAFVVPERELERFGEAGVLDLLELATEIQELVARDRAA